MTMSRPLRARWRLVHLAADPGLPVPRSRADPDRAPAHAAESKFIDVATFKTLAGVTRKNAIPLLEYLDGERVTLRVGDKRQIIV